MLVSEKIPGTGLKSN